jgi:hypothetical protein
MSKPYPLDEALYARVKRAAMRKFDVYPSIPANSWIVREYKRLGGKYGGTRKEGGLVRWFDEQWVDISRPRKDGTFPFCARSSQGSKSYPKCVPLATAEGMTEAERVAAVARKRKAEKSAPRRKGRRPVNAKTF